MIPKGSEVLKCAPFAHVVALDSRETVCDGCMRLASEDDVEKFKKCSGCKAVFYCRITCQKTAWTSYHRDECQSLRKVRKLYHDIDHLMIFLVQKNLVKWSHQTKSR